MHSIGGKKNKTMDEMNIGGGSNKVGRRARVEGDHDGDEDDNHLSGYT
jgi:hypothetical protein